MSFYLAAVFDLDGTILDTLQDLYLSVNHSLKAFSLPERSLDEVRLRTGNGIRRLIDLSVPQGTSVRLTDQVFEEFKRYYAVHCEDNTRPYPGIEEMLRSLRERKIRTAVVSNKADFAVQKLITQQFPGLFDYTVGERAGIRRKPAPDTVLACLKAFSLRPDEAVYIGDSEVDIETGRAACMDSIIVSWGFRDPEFLKEQGAEKIVSSPQDLIPYFEP